MMVVQLQREFGTWREMVPWLTEHCGPVLNSKPIVHWKGREWELIYEIAGRWQVSIDNDQLMTAFILRWS
jgi:hypothetical protein